MGQTTSLNIQETSSALGATELFVVNAAKKWLDADLVILFGSRAKKSNTDLSDFDFAVQPAEDKKNNWPFFWNDIDENAPTLNKIDLINLSSNIRAEFRDEILRTGTVLWSKIGACNKQS